MSKSYYNNKYTWNKIEQMHQKLMLQRVALILPPPQQKLRTKPRASGPTTELKPQSQELLFRE